MDVGFTVTINDGDGDGEDRKVFEYVEPSSWRVWEVSNPTGLEVAAQKGTGAIHDVPSQRKTWARSRAFTTPSLLPPLFTPIQAPAVPQDIVAAGAS